MLVHRKYLFLYFITFLCSLGNFLQGKELKYYTSRENKICKADGIRPYQGLFKKLACSDEKAGKLCENDKFCPFGERCLCHNQCEEFRCRKPDVALQTSNSTKCSDKDPCKNNGVCTNGKCNCTDPYTGNFCEQMKRDYCESSPCVNGVCHPHTDKYFCNCSGTNYTGDQCEKRDFCINHNCTKNQFCRILENRKTFECVCKDSSMTGQNCDTKINECKAVTDACVHGTCVDQPQGYRCDCDSLYTGPRCDIFNGYCRNNTCENGGHCVENVTSSSNFSCSCQHGFSGSRCENELICETMNPCQNNGTCEEGSSDNSTRCLCLPGFTGTRCETKTSKCYSNPCLNGGTCLGSFNTYTCLCKDNFVGPRCENTDPCIGNFDREHCEKQMNCTHDCDNLNGTCIPECNVPECSFGRGDCTLGVLSPWQECSQKKCWAVFDDGKCNLDCNNPGCLLDGGDCFPAKNCTFEGFCDINYNNSVCDETCNNAQCGFDGQDCRSEDESFIPGNLILTVQATRQVFDSNKKALMRELSKLLKTTVIFNEVTTKRSRRDTLRQDGLLEIKTSLRTNGKCAECLQTTTETASFLAGKASKGSLVLPVPLVSVRALKGEEPGKNKPGHNILVILLLTFGIPAAIVVVVIGTKRVASSTWLPPAPGHHGKASVRAEPVGQEGDEMTSLQRNSGGDESLGSCASASSTEFENNVKRFKQDLEWAAGCNVIDSMPCQLPESDELIPSPTEPISEYSYRGKSLHTAARINNYEEAMKLLRSNVDVNAKDEHGRSALHVSVSVLSYGVFQLLLRNRKTHIDIQANDGSTPLMVACEKLSSKMVDDLISTGAKVQLTDKQGNTALHYCARTDNSISAQSLLKNNAKIDVQNLKGQSPLFIAATYGCYITAEMLIKMFHANYSLPDSGDRTPLKMAQLKGHHDIVNLITECSSRHPIKTSPISSGANNFSDIRPKLVSNNHLQNHFPYEMQQSNQMSSHPKRKRKAKPKKDPQLSYKSEDIGIFTDFIPEIQCMVDNFPSIYDEHLIHSSYEPNYDVNPNTTIRMHPFPTPESVHGMPYSPGVDSNLSPFSLLTPSTSPESVESEAGPY